MKFVVFCLLGSFRIFAATPGVDVYPAKELRQITEQLAAKKSKFASRDLKQYQKNYTLLAERSSDGSAEVHEHEADVYFVVSGEATLVSGGKVVSPHTQKPGEIRGTAISGGERQHLGTGDVVHIAANVPHQLLVSNGTVFSYFVVKVTDQTRE